MKLVIQRVNSASVAVGEKVVGEIGKGLFVLLGVGKDDSEETVDYNVAKLLKVRIMPDSDGKMNLSIMDTTKEILVVSQFTLYADTAAGNRPSFIQAADPKKANEVYTKFVAKLEKSGCKVQTGSFGKYMCINAVLDGPVTISLEK